MPTRFTKHTKNIAITTTTVGTTAVVAVVDVTNLKFGSVQLDANQGSGNVEGQWLLEGSNDGSGYVDLGDGADPPAAIDATAGTAQRLLLRLGVIDFDFLRITFTPTAGAGPIKATVGGKNV
jgi:hypothetical protein